MGDGSRAGLRRALGSGGEALRPGDGPGSGTATAVHAMIRGDTGISQSPGTGKRRAASIRLAVLLALVALAFYLAMILLGGA